MQRRVVITGVGALSAIGVGAAAFSAALRAGRSARAPIRSFDASGFPHDIACELKGARPAEFVRKIDPDEWGSASVAAAAAARLAVDDAGADPAELRRGRAGSVMGTTAGEFQLFEGICESWVGEGFPAVRGDQVRHVPAYRLAVAANRELGLSGEAVTISTACAASSYAIGYAFDAIRGGDAEYMIAGGAEGGMGRFPLAGFHRIGAMAKEACSPFDKDRSGILVGEGSSAVFLETLDTARARGATIYAEVLGYGLNCDAKHPISPDAGGIAECMRRAHRNAGVKSTEVDYICAHGTGTPSNDAAEYRAVRDVFGERLPPMSSIKSMIGHTMGAAGCFGAIASALAIKDGFLPPTINMTCLDPDFAGLDAVPNTAREADLRIVQNNSFAFGGNNAITILGRVE
jgi:3-oxoacyl-[acyl-carrier-protein] synthase II